MQEELTTDLTRESLIMNANLCLAQAQYLFLRKVREANRSPEFLSKVCAQISLYFQKAFEANTMNRVLIEYQNKQFGNKLGYFSKYYMAMAYQYLSDAECAQVNENKRGWGKAITLLKITIGKFSEAKKFADVLDG